MSSVEVLGAMLADDGEQRLAIDHRLNKAECVFWKYQRVLCRIGGHTEKMKAWDSTVVSSAAYVGGTMALTKELAVRMHGWEHRMLRKVLRLHPKDGECQDNDSWATYLNRTREIIDSPKVMTTSPHLVHRMLLSYVDEAWTEKTRRDRDGGNRTQGLRHYRCREWWEQIIRTPYNLRKLVGWVHGRPGVTGSSVCLFVTL